MMVGGPALGMSIDTMATILPFAIAEMSWYDVTRDFFSGKTAHPRSNLFSLLILLALS
jgi:hypothetical protein